MGQEREREKEEEREKKSGERINFDSLTLNSSKVNGDRELLFTAYAT
jgi:hypothetical protein